MRRIRTIWSRAIPLFYAVQIRAQESCLDGLVIDSNAQLAYFQAMFPEIGFRAPTGNPFLGAQNLTYCCVKAVDQWLANKCQNDSEVRISDRILQPQTQFPCGAYWIGNPQGAPEVDVSYGWSTANCPGWQLSDANSANEWTQLLVAFILPAVVFSFNIPRPSMLKEWKGVLPEKFSDYKVIGTIPGAIGAAICVSVDTIVWLMVSFAFASPLLLSGLYEALLDKRILVYLRKQTQHSKIPTALQARILFTVLCGNLDLKSAWCDTMDLATRLDKLDREWPEFQRLANQPPLVRVSFHKGERAESFPPSTVPSPNSLTGQSYEDILPAAGALSDPHLLLGVQDSRYEQRDTDPLSLQQHPGISNRNHIASLGIVKDPLVSYRTRSVTSVSEYEVHHSGDERVTTHPKAPDNRSKIVHKVVIRLKAMLACQYSFGSTIGGPIVFFLGAFVYTLLDISQNVGNGVIAETLAFGMWWTIIPHIATIAGLLLAGNNPNILEAIVSKRGFRYTFGEHLVNGGPHRELTSESAATTHRKPKRGWHSKLLESVYDVDAGYMPAWMWERGRSKQDWLILLFADSWLKYQTPSGDPPKRIRMALKRFLREAVMLTFIDWLVLWIFTLLLVGVPVLFAFITSYYTPPIGVACRSITVTLYLSAQTLLSMLWMYHLTYKDKYWATAWNINSVLRGRQTQLTRIELHGLLEQVQHHGRKDTASTNQHSQENGYNAPLSGTVDTSQLRDENTFAAGNLFIALCTLGFLVSLFTSIGGNMFQMIGVYGSCFCLLDASEWLSPKRSASFIPISSNTVEDIRTSQRYWIILGACNVVFLALVCYIGWWYQRSLRSRFKTVAESMEEEHEAEGSEHGEEDDDLGDDNFLANEHGRNESEYELTALR